MQKYQGLIRGLRYLQHHVAAAAAAAAAAAPKAAWAARSWAWVVNVTLFHWVSNIKCYVYSLGTI
jgi:hypothetical protein